MPRPYRSNEPGQTRRLHTLSELPRTSEKPRWGKLHVSPRPDRTGTPVPCPRQDPWRAHSAGLGMNPEAPRND
jgi:hypothetical protein